MKKIGSLNRVIDVLSELSPQHIVILPHVRVDPDALGSSFGFKEYLNQLGHQVRIILDEVPSNNIKFISDDYSPDIYFEGIESELKKPDLLVFIDHNDISRLSQRSHIVEKFPNTDLLIIDHHKVPEKTEADFMTKFNSQQRTVITWLESERSSVSEMIAELFCSEYSKYKTGKSPALNKKTATALLAGIYGDTGGLRFSNTSKRTFEICGCLKQEDIDISSISEQLFGGKPLTQLRLIGDIFANSNINAAGNIIWYTVKTNFLKKYDSVQDDLEGVCSQMREVENIDLALLIREISDQEIRVNLRSNHAIDVSKLASKFGGGGHARAAGITFLGNNDLKKIETKLIAEAELMLNG